jgi:hypothetical protein
MQGWSLTNNEWKHDDMSRTLDELFNVDCSALHAGMKCFHDFIQNTQDVREYLGEELVEKTVRLINVGLS